MKNKQVRIYTAAIVLQFFVLAFLGKPVVGVSIGMILGGILGLATNTIPFQQTPRNYNPKYTNSYSKNSLSGPIINIGTILLGLMLLGN